MKKNDLFRKGLVYAIVVLFIGVSIVPLTGIGAENHCLINDSIGYFNSIRKSEERGVNVTLNGTMGENGWYVSCVYIQISFGPDIDSFYYQFNGGSWCVYTGPFGPICEDGEYMFCWYYVDNGGNQSDVECIDFKIDQTDPTINLTIEKIGFRKWLITADVYDETSGVNRVELYVNDEYLGEVTGPPYELTYSGNRNMAQVIVYDNAGNYGVPPTSVFGIIRNPEFTEETVSFFAIVVISNNLFPFGMFWQQLTFQNDYSGYIGDHFIFAVFRYGPV